MQKYNGWRTSLEVKRVESKELVVNVGVPLGLVLTLLLFIIAHEALSIDFTIRLPRELLYMQVISSCLT